MPRLMPKLVPPWLASLCPMRHDKARQLRARIPVYLDSIEGQITALEQQRAELDEAIARLRAGLGQDRRSG